MFDNNYDCFEKTDIAEIISTFPLAQKLIELCFVTDCIVDTFSEEEDTPTKVVTFSRIDADVDVKLDVQLWSDGLHRVSHWKRTSTGYGMMNTAPTDFTNEDSMLKAIEFERIRDSQ